ncbi:hypothetical protein A2U01_0083874, partial [Trifolium medium]|nr:hypothetical protein [Trifolium medium]
VIYAEFGRENHGSILRNCDRDEAGTPDVRTDLRTRLGANTRVKNQISRS